MKKNILFVVDMQKDFVHGVFGTKEAKAIVDDVKKLVDESRKNGDLIIYTQDTHSSEDHLTQEEIILPVHCVKGTSGHDLVDELIPNNNEVLMEKRSFVDEDLKEKLMNILQQKNISYEEIGTITLVGICTDICVVSNALSLRSIFPFTDVKVIANLCAGTTPQAHDAALQVMKSCLVNVVE